MVCGVRRAGCLRRHHADRALRLTANAARPTVLAERNHHGTRRWEPRRVGSNKVYGEFEERIAAQDLPHALYFREAFRPEGRYWHGMKIPPQKLVGRVAD